MIKSTISYFVLHNTCTSQLAPVNCDLNLPRSLIFSKWVASFQIPSRSEGRCHTFDTKTWTGCNGRPPWQGQKTYETKTFFLISCARSLHFNRASSRLSHCWSYPSAFVVSRSVLRLLHGFVAGFKCFAVYLLLYLYPWITLLSHLILVRSQWWATERW